MTEQNATLAAKKGTPAKGPKAAPKTAEQRAQEKRARFLNLAPSRVQKALYRIRQVKACAAKTGYTYTEEEAGKVVAALEAAVREVRAAFSGAAAQKQTFSL